MKIVACLAAGLVAAASLAPTAASAQHRVVHERIVTRHVERRGYRHGRHHRVVCNTHWYHHRRVRRCHTVRY